MFRKMRPSAMPMYKNALAHSPAPMVRDAAVRAVVEHLECRQFLTATLTDSQTTDNSSLLSQSADLKTLSGPSFATLAAAPAMTSGNVGALNPTGSTAILEEGVSYNVTAGGPNISGTSDAFRYVYRQQTGDFDVKVQVSSFPTSRTTAKAGIMARETLTSGSRHVFSTATAGDGYRLLYRLTTGGDTTTVKVGTPSYPNVWVRLQREGNLFTGYQSTDGVNWTVTGQATVGLPSTVYIGLATASTASGTSVTAQYRNLGDVAPATPVAPAAPANLSTQALTSSSIDVTWNAVSGATLYRIQRKAPGESSFTDYQTTTSPILHDTGLTAGSTYAYQVRAENSADVSTFAGPVSQTTPTQNPSPAPTAYTSLDINSKPAGSTTVVTPGVDYDITAGGTDIYGSADSFRFVYAQRTGDFDVKVQLSSISKAATKSKGGLMVRELLTAGSRTVFSGATNSSGFRFGSRSTNNGNFTNAYTSGTVSYPNVWLRLKRAGNVFTGYRSTDGVNWTQMGQINISLPTTVYVGTATASTVSTATTLAKYRNLSDVASQAPIAPATPTGLNAQSAGTSQINLTWNAVSGATLYRIQRQAPGQSSFTDWTTTASTSFNDLSLSANSTYSYKVRAENGSLVSAYTASVSAKTDAIIAAPAVPANLVAAAVSSSQINLSWDAVSGATLYRIQRQGPGEASFNDFTTSNTNSFSDLGLAANSTYSYKVRAENGTLSSAYTAAKSAKTDAVIVTPGIPANLDVTAVTSSQINLTWDATPNATLYRIQRKAPGEIGFTNFATTTSAGYQDLGLMPNSPYAYQVRAENGSAVSAYTSPQQTNTLSPTAPVAPSNLAAQAVSTTQIDLTWDAVVGTTLYRIQRKGPDDLDFVNYRTTSGTFIHDIGLQAGKTYAYQVRGEDNGVPGDYTTPVEANTGLPAPTGFDGQATSPSEIDLVWNAVAGATFYRIQRQGPGEKSFANYTTSTTAHFEDTGLDADRPYAYQIRAENDEGAFSVYTASLTRSTPPIPVAPAIPTGFSAVANSQTQVTLQWTTTAGTTLYRVQRQGPADFDFVEFGTTTNTTLTDNTVSAGQTYSYRVRAENGPSLVSDYTDAQVVNTPTVPAMTSIDIGTTGGATTVVSNGIDYDVTSSGNDIYNSADSFRLVYKQITGDFDMQVKVASLSLSDPKFKAGLMARESLAAGSRSIFGGLTSTDGFRFATRSSTSGATTNVKGGTSSFPMWVRLRRVGNTFTAYRSTDGLNWTQYGQTTMSLPSTLYFGLATCGDSGATATAQYRSLGAGNPSTLPAAPTHISWTTGTDAPFARQEAIAIQVGSKLYVWGGFIDQDLNVTNTGYVQDLATGQWTSIASTPLMQTHVGVATDGTYIYIAGGQTGPKDSNNAHAECFKYNIATNKWSSFTSLPAARLGGALEYLNGRLYFIGGDMSDRLTVSEKTFSIPVDESTGWIDTHADLPDPVDHLSVAVLNGRIYAIGGDTDHGFSYISHDTVRYYDPATNKWTVVAPMPTPASHFEGATIVVNGRIVAIGGQAPNVELMDEVRVYDPVADKWTVLEHIPGVRKGGIAAYYNGKLYYISGRAETSTGGHVNVKTTYVGTITNPW